MMNEDPRCAPLLTDASCERILNDAVDLPALPTPVKNVFVVMPFSPTVTMPEPNDWTETYEDVFKPAVEAVGYSCARAEVTTGSLMSSIVEELRTARIVLADITDRNANVFYELGVRHALSKRTIIVAQTAKHIPSDLGGYWTIVYGRSPRQVKTFASDLARTIAHIEANPERADSPVGVVLERDNANVIAVFQRENAKKLTALYTEITGNIVVLEHVSDTLELRAQLLTSCLDLLLQTLYVDLGPETLRRAYELMQDLRRLTLSKPDKNLPRAQRLVSDLDYFAKEVADARDRLVKGTFSEPPTISNLIWKPNPASTPATLEKKWSFCAACGRASQRTGSGPNCD